MARGLALLAMICIGADEHPPAAVVEDHFVQIDVARGAHRAGLGEFLDVEGVVLKIEADHLRMRRDGIDALLAAGPKSCSASDMCIFGLSNFGVGDGSIT